ncbi:17631_t:CDS:2, partial [Gigaspora rosea]
QPITPISPETATIITLTIISIALIVLIIICVHKSCNKRKRNQRRNNKVPDFQSGQYELRTLTQKQINSLPTDQQRKLRQYQQALQQGNNFFNGKTQPTTIFQTTTATAT